MASSLQFRTAMPIRDHEDLVCWQLAHELEIKIYAFTNRPPASRDFEFKDQIREASASASSNRRT